MALKKKKKKRARDHKKYLKAASENMLTLPTSSGCSSANETDYGAFERLICQQQSTDPFQIPLI